MQLDLGKDSPFFKVLAAIDNQLIDLQNLNVCTERKQEGEPLIFFFEN